MTEALTLIDAFLDDTKHQSLIDADKVHDLLLDLRSLLVAPAPTLAEFVGHCVSDVIEGEPYEDTYLPGVPDYDRFGRASWDVPE
jgi:hypothetical protein